MSLFQILDQNVPTVYELDFCEDALLIRIHGLAYKFLIKTLSTFKPRTDLNIELLKFEPPDRKDWGFGSCLVQFRNEPNWVWLRCCMPQIRKNSDKLDWQNGYGVSASLKLLFNTLNAFPDNTGYVLPQLLLITGMMANASAELGGGAISVMISKQLLGWIHKQPQEFQVKEMVSAMKKAHDCIWPKKRDEKLLCEREFKAHFSRPCWVGLCCPGNACDLSSDYFEIGRKGFNKKGHELIAHNIDGPLQQLTLLAGVAKMYKLAREEGF